MSDLDKPKVFSLGEAVEKINTGFSVSGSHTSGKILNKPPRQIALEEAIGLTVGARQETYGPPVQNLSRTADLVRAYLGTRSIDSFNAADMAVVNILIKLSRLATNPTHRDSWVDAAAYAAIGLECAQELNKDKT